jgi:GTP-binding nuclear protein Ran
MSSSLPPLSFKVVVVGDGGVGKTTWLKQLQSGRFEGRYTPTLGVVVQRIHFNTPVGPIKFNMWDTAGQEKLRSVDGYYSKSNAALVFYEAGHRSSYKNCCSYITQIKRVCGDIPIILVQTKIDIEHKDTIPCPALEDYPVISISSRGPIDIYAPFDYLLQILVDPALICPPLQ